MPFQGLNLILRLAWLQTVLHSNFGSVDYRVTGFFLAALEVIRRGQWNFYRYNHFLTSTIQVVNDHVSFPSKYLYITMTSIDVSNEKMQLIKQKSSVVRIFQWWTMTRLHWGHPVKFTSVTVNENPWTITLQTAKMVHTNVLNLSFSKYYMGIIGENHTTLWQVAEWHASPYILECDGRPHRGHCMDKSCTNQMVMKHCFSYEIWSHQCAISFSSHPFDCHWAHKWDHPVNMNFLKAPSMVGPMVWFNHLSKIIPQAAIYTQLIKYTWSSFFLNELFINGPGWRMSISIMLTTSELSRLYHSHSMKWIKIDTIHPPTVVS